MAPRILSRSDGAISEICTEYFAVGSISRRAPPVQLVVHGPFGSLYNAMQPFEQVIVQLECPGAVHVDMIFFLGVAKTHLRVGESNAECKAPLPF